MGLLTGMSSAHCEAPLLGARDLLQQLTSASVIPFCGLSSLCGLSDAVRGLSDVDVGIYYILHCTPGDSYQY